jgi:o-succinylbenzoate synthase
VSATRPWGADGAELAVRVGLTGIDRIVPFEVPLTTRFRGVTVRHGLLLHGAAGWAEWSPFDEYADDIAARWLAGALEAACQPPPPARRPEATVNVTVPAVDPDTAHALVVSSGCRTAKVKVAEPGGSLAADVARVAAVRDALGPDGHVRVDANGAWDVAAALTALAALAEAAGGLEYVEQPCHTLAELAEVRRRGGVPVAADEAIRRDGVGVVALRQAVDVAVVKLQPSGGARALLALAETIGLPVVVSSALETSVGLAAGVRLAAALPQAATCGLATALLLGEDVVPAPLRPVDGAITVVAADAAAAALVPEVPRPAPAVAEWMLARLASSAALLPSAPAGGTASTAPSAADVVATTGTDSGGGTR